MYICIKDFAQYKEGDKLPLSLPKEVGEKLIKQGFAKWGGRSNAYVADYIKRTKDDKKKNYYRKPRKRD